MSSGLTIEPISRSRLSQQIMLQVCALIRKNQLVPGDKLPSERDLAERLQVSRASLREALTALEAAGIIMSRHGGGRYVRDFHDIGVISPLALALAPTDDLIGELCEVRVIFEPIVAAQAAVRVTDEDVDSLRRLIEEQHHHLDSPNDSDTFLNLDRQFHTSIAVLSGNRVSVRVLELINMLLMDGRRHFTSVQDGRTRTTRHHESILAAIEARDPRAARDAMLKHLLAVELHISGELLEQSIDDGYLGSDGHDAEGNDDLFDRRLYASRRSAGPWKKSGTGSGTLAN